MPAEIGWWPLAPGWWVLVAAAAAGVLWLLFRAYRDWRSKRARRIALRQLRAIGRQLDGNDDLAALGVQLSELLRRAMLAYAPRDEVAGLTGAEWLAWLDRGLDEPLFADGPGRAINTLPYRKSGADADVDVDGLLAAVRLRISTPLAEGAA